MLIKLKHTVIRYRNNSTIIKTLNKITLLVLIIRITQKHSFVRSRWFTPFLKLHMRQSNITNTTDGAKMLNKVKRGEIKVIPVLVRRACT